VCKFIASVSNAAINRRPFRFAHERERNGKENKNRVLPCTIFEGAWVIIRVKLGEEDKSFPWWYLAKR